MPFPLRFLVLCLPNVPWPDLRERFVRLEALGVEVGALPDHFVDWTKPASPWFESWTALTGLAAATSSIRIATHVTQIALRNPAVFARQVLTLDHVSDGRVEVGLGTGITVDPSYDMIGVPNWEPAERVARLAEYVEIVERLLGDEVTSFDGRYYQVDGAHMNPRPDPVAATAGHRRRARACPDAARRPAGRYLEQHVVPRGVRGAGR